MPAAKRLSKKAVKVLSLIAEGRSYGQIVGSHPDITYRDIFDAAREALVAHGALPVNRGRMAQSKARHPRAYERWTDDEDAELTSMLRQGKATEEIAAQLRRQPSAVRSRIAKLDLASP